MPRTTALLALALIVLGVVSRAVTGSTSVTVWIPSALGALMLVAGLLWRRGHPRFGRAAIHALAFVGFVGSFVKLGTGGFALDTPAGQAQALTILLCGGVLVTLRRSRP